MFEKTIEAPTLDRVIELFGSYDENIKLIENEFNVKIINRNELIKISGKRDDMEKAAMVLEKLLNLLQKGEITDTQTVRYAISLVKDNNAEAIDELGTECICVTSKGRPVKPKTIGQKKYAESILKNTITICVGPAGTGKTYLAVTNAVAAFKKKEINKIILTRPAVEAGENLGFLPGDLQDKVDPYLRPLYDALFDMIGAEAFQKHMEKGAIEVAPLAYMRGRTLDESFIILDEAQNTTHEQMKMFLTRIGFNSKAVITGDITQTDLPHGKTSGLKEVLKILQNIDDIAIHMLTDRDVVRHPLVMKIIKAYAEHEKKSKQRFVKKQKGV